MILAPIIFYLGMTYAMVKERCPTQLIPMRFDGHSYYACDTRKKTVILAVEDNKVIAIMDVAWFAIVMDKDKPKPGDCPYGRELP